MLLPGIRPPSLRVLWRTAVLALAIGSAACSDDDDPVTPSTVTVAAGTTVNATAGASTGGSGTINITRSNFTGPVTVTFTGGTGFPSTITLPSPVTIGAGASSGTFTINVPAGVAAGTYPITVTTSGSGLTTQTSTVNLVVAAGQGAQSITVALDSTARRINAGQTVTQNITITRVGGFTGPVNLAVDTTTLPRGVRATLGTSTLATGVSTTTLTLVADSNAAVSNTAVNVRINATGTGVTAQSATIALTVAQAPGVTFGFIGTNNAATVQAGGTQTFRFLVNRQGGFTGPVTFTADSASLPRGVTLVSTTFSGDTAIATFRADSATAQAGSFTVNLRGAGTGITTRTFALPITVQPRGTFTVRPTGQAAGDTAALRVNAQVGTTVTLPVRITRTGGFTGNVVFAGTGLPAGVTLTADSATAAGAADTLRTVRITVPANLAPGTYPITLTSGTPGLTTQSTRLSLVVTATPPTNFGFTVGQPIVSVGAGGTSTVSFPVTRSSGFTGGITFTSTGAPIGLNVTGPTAAVTGDTARFTFAPNAGLQPGVYPVSIVGGATGQGNVTQTLLIGVAPAAGGVAASVLPGQVLLAAGDTARVDVGFARAAGFTDTLVAVVQNVLPAGITVTPTQSAIGGSQTQLRVQVASTVPAGRYPVVVVIQSRSGQRYFSTGFTIVVGAAGTTTTGGTGTSPTTGTSRVRLVLQAR